jgi:murein DD-endopeptidase
MTCSMKRHLLFIIVFAICAIASASFATSAQISNPPVFALPIKCTIGEDCYIMHYVDLDPGREPVDFGCGRQTYAHHDGTDFGIADFESMKRDVPVMAAAYGIVLRVRDNVADQLITDQTERVGVQNIECGNGIVIDHGNGWQTQYCHLRKGSVAVKKGDKVNQGNILGMVGTSGLASFPHLHFTVRHLGKVIDPFVGETNVSGCSATRHPLWENTPDYIPAGLIRAGFASKPPDQAALWRGEFIDTKADSAKLPALVFWVHVFGTLKGDKEHFTLIAPNKRIMVDTEKPLTKNNRSWVSYVGKRNPTENPLSQGEWRGTYQLKRGERLLIRLERRFLVE